MGRPYRIVLGLALALAFGSAVWLTLTPRIGTATQSEVLALIPRHLREAPLADSVAEARFMAVYRLIREGSKENESRLAELVESGPWRVPARFVGQNVEWPFDGLSEVFSERIVESAHKGDRAKCAKTAHLALGLVNAYSLSGGELLDAEVATQMLGPLADSLEEAVSKGGLTADDRAGLLQLVPKDDGAGSVADAIATGFRAVLLPRLLRAARGSKSTEAVLDECSLPSDPGTYDPLDTARLFVRFTEIDLRACRLGPQALSPAEKRLPHEVLDGLPTRPFPPTNAWEGFRYRWSLNHGPNTLGRWWAVSHGLTDGFDLVSDRAEAWQRIRLALKMGSGAPPNARPPRPTRIPRVLPEYLD